MEVLGNEPVPEPIWLPEIPHHKARTWKLN